MKTSSHPYTLEFPNVLEALCQEREEDQIHISYLHHSFDAKI